MKHAFEARPRIGIGVYTLPDVAGILDIPYHKVHRWVNEYLNNRLGKNFDAHYTWSIDTTKAVSFHTLVELHTFFQLSKAGVRSDKILEAHALLAKKFDTTFPFAFEPVLAGLRTDGRCLYHKTKDSKGRSVILDLDGTYQLSLAFIKLFFKKLDFGDDLLAERYWPIGKSNSIVCDPRKKFGQPIIDGTGVPADAIYGMKEAKRKPAHVAKLYSITEKQVKDAIEYCEKAA